MELKPLLVNLLSLNSMKFNLLIGCFGMKLNDLYIGFMKLKLLFITIVLFVVCRTSYGQVTIVSDGLNNTTSLFTLTGGGYYTGNSGSGDGAASSPFVSEGTHSRGVTNGTATLTTTSNVNTSLYSGISLSLRLASFSLGSLSNGADATDIVTVEISPDGGTTYYSTVRILGNSNAYWSYSGGTGVASTSYDGNATPVDFQPAAGGSRTTDGYSTVTVSNIPATNTLRVRITLLNNSSNERWVLDDFKITGTAIPTGTSTITSGAATEPSTISSLIDTSGESVLNFDFIVKDDGATDATDALATKISQIVIDQGTGNDISDWTQAIAGASLSDGTTTQTANISMNSTNITIASIVNTSITDLGYIADNATKTYTLKIWLKSSLGGSLPSTIDGQNLVFRVQNSGFTFNGGSTLITGQDQNSGITNNTVAVVATKLAFEQQPGNNNVNVAMSPSSTVTATDANGNVDLGFTGIVSLTSTGTMNSSPQTATAVAGVATFSSIVHSVVGTGLTLGATATGLTSSTSTSFNIVTATTFSKGDFAVIGVNSNFFTCASAPYNALPYQSGDDEISFIVFKNIQSGDTFYMTDNGYERANAGLWGDTEGVYQITRTGSTIPAGTVITFRLLNNATTIAESVSPDTNWSFTKVAGFSGNIVMNTGGDQLFFMQGSTWNNPGGTHDATYNSGTYLYGFNTNNAWQSLGNDTKKSALPIELTCFSLTPGSATDYIEYTGPTTAAAKLDWIARLNNPLNWTDRTSCAGYLRTHVGKTYTVLTTGTFVNGVWTGAKSTDWFDCSNWQTLDVPDQSIDVNVNTTYATRDAKVDATSTKAPAYGSIAKCNNLTISSNKVQVDASANNKLEVHGNLSIITAGELDMSDGTNGTPDGQLYLYGNWTNYQETKFKQGESTVHFVGTTPQTVFCTDKTEIFFNVNLANANNLFTTDSFNSDLIAEGSLTLSNGSDLTIKSGHYALATKNLSVGTGSELIIEHTGSLVQTDDTGTVFNSGTIKVNKTTTPFEKYDYTYWSSPIVTPTIASTFPTWRTDYAFYFDPTKFEDLHTIVGGITTISGTPDGFDDNEDDWVNATTMTPGKGYIIMGPTSGTFPMTQSVTFTGTVNNGVKTTAVSLTPGIPTDDDWNLVGNPYPSAISADAFINANIIGTGSINQTINGTLYFWTHKADIGAGANLGPDALNFSQDDYAVYTLAGGTGTSGSISGGSKPLGYIASGQAFFVEAQAAGNVAFNNSMRATSHSNSQFYKTKSAKSKAVSKNRLWLNLENSLGMFSQQLVGYFDNATLGYDNGYDGLLNDAGNYINFYSFIDSDTYKIQARPAFDENDQVKLGYSSAIAGTFSIDIDSKEGIFTYTDTNVYLEDKLLETIHDLKNPYTFNTEAGTFNDRFVLRYTNKTLGTKDYESLENQVVISNKNKQIKVYSKAETIDNVVVYDLLGRKLFQKDKVDSSEIIISNLISSQQVLLVKVILKKGNEVTKKVVF